MKSGRRSVLALVAAVVALGAMASCSTDPVGDENATVTADSVIYPLSLRYHGIDVVADVPYGTDPLQRLDVCLPADSDPRDGGDAVRLGHRRPRCRSGRGHHRTPGGPDDPRRQLVAR
ncbi:hypothetical protein WDV91_03550 [Curtobacterium flaccumfaciens pv. flaccumfaciens]